MSDKKGEKFLMFDYLNAEGTGRVNQRPYNFEWLFTTRNLKILESWNESYDMILSSLEMVDE